MQSAKFARFRFFSFGGVIVAAAMLAASPQVMAQTSTGAAGTSAAPPAAVAPAQAVPPKPGKAGRLDKKACRAELAALCAKTTGSRTKCLIANQSKLGPACAAAVAQTVQVREVAKAACVVDAKKLCGSAKGEARTLCLEANKPQLSPACLARIEKKELKAAASKATQPPKQ